MFCLARKPWIKCAEWAGALLWWSCQISKFSSSSNLRAKSDAYPCLICNFSDCERQFWKTRVRTCSMTLSLRFVEGLPERGSLSTDVFEPVASPKSYWILRMVFAWISRSFWQNLMQYLWSMFSVILQILKFDKCSLQVFTRWPTISNWPNLRAG